MATGVRSAAADTTATAMRNGSGDTCSSAATEMAIGRMMSAVAVLLISWPKTRATRQRAPRTTIGPESPTMPMSPVAIISAVPVWVIAVDIGIMPATSSSVVQEMERCARSTVTARVSTIAPAASRPVTAGGKTPVASATTMSTRMHQRRPGTSTERCGLTAHGVRCIDDDDLGVGEVGVERIPVALQQEHVADLEHDLAVLQVLAGALHGQDHQVAALRHHAGEHRRPDEGRPRRHEHLGDPRPGVEEGRLRGIRSQSGVVAQQHAGLVTEVARHRRRRAVGNDEALQAPARAAPNR